MLLKTLHFEEIRVGGPIVRICGPLVGILDPLTGIFDALLNHEMLSL
jgi:hypothetical protein